MVQLTPAQRTAGTARFIMAGGVLAVLEAVMRGSIAWTLFASVVLVLGGGLLIAAKNAD